MSYFIFFCLSMTPVKIQIPGRVTQIDQVLVRLGEHLDPSPMSLYQLGLGGSRTISATRAEESSRVQSPLKQKLLQ